MSLVDTHSSLSMQSTCSLLAGMMACVLAVFVLFVFHLHASILVFLCRKIVLCMHAFAHVLNNHDLIMSVTSLPKIQVEGRFFGTVIMSDKK